MTVVTQAFILNTILMINCLLMRGILYIVTSAIAFIIYKYKTERAAFVLIIYILWEISNKLLPEDKACFIVSNGRNITTVHCWHGNVVHIFNKIDMHCIQKNMIMSTIVYLLLHNKKCFLFPLVII